MVSFFEFLKIITFCVLPLFVVGCGMGFILSELEAHMQNFIIILVIAFISCVIIIYSYLLYINLIIKFC